MKPQLWVIAGPNGAGKSTLADRYVRDRIPLVNPDNILADSPELSPIVAGKRALAQMDELLAEKQAFAWETTLSGNRELIRMHQAKDLDYKVNLVFVGVKNARTSYLRVAERVAAGGAIYRRIRRNGSSPQSRTSCGGTPQSSDNRLILHEIKGSGGPRASGRFHP